MFSGIDKIYCINLITRDDRFEEAKEQFEALGILDKVSFLRVDKHKKSGGYGCFESHMACINDAKVQAFSNILIFEDDAKLCADNALLMKTKRLVEALIETGDFERINLGYVHSLYKEQDAPDFYIGRSTVATASIINKRFIDKIAYLEPTEECHTLDDYFCYKMQKNYILKEPIFIQRISPSDNPWDNGQEKYSDIWDAINVKKTIDYEVFQRTNHDLEAESQDKRLHALHIVLKYFKQDDYQSCSEAYQHHVSKLVSGISEGIDSHNLEDFYALYPALSKISAELLAIEELASYC